MIEDRLTIKTTQRLKRHISSVDIKKFFTKKRYDLMKVEEKFIKDIDEVIKEFLEEIKDEIY